MNILKLLYYGTWKMADESNLALTWYALLIGTGILSVIFFEGFVSVILIILFISALALGIRYYRLYILPIKQMREFFHGVFAEMKFQVAERYPYFLSRSDISKLIVAYSFKTHIPLKMWTAKKDHFEMYLNERIIDIKQDEHDKRTIHLHVQRESLPELIRWKDKYIHEDNILNIGVSHYGLILGMDLERHPHSFIAGETGSGKSNILKCLIHQALFKGFEVVLIDFKRGVSFSEFSNAVTVYYDYKEVLKELSFLVGETDSRLDKFRAAGVDNIIAYNRVTGDCLNKIIVFIDELAELLKTKDKETASILNSSIETLTRLSRAVGIHLIMGIQRPDSTIISGQIKNNVSYRVCGRFVDKEPSRIMLGSDTANALPNIKGRFIIKDDDLHEVQSFYFEGNNIPQRIIEEQPPPIEQTEPNPVEESNTTLPKQKETLKQSSDFEFDFSNLKK